MVARILGIPYLVLTPYDRVRLFNTYVHAFLNGAFDEAARLGGQQS